MQAQIEPLAAATAENLTSSASTTAAGFDVYITPLVSANGLIVAVLTSIEPQVIPDDLLVGDELGFIIPWAYLLAQPGLSISAFEAEAHAAPSALAFLEAVRIQSNADSAIIWTLDNLAGTKQRRPTMRATAIAGAKTGDESFSVPVGRGIVGRLGPADVPVICDLRDGKADVYNRSKVRDETWTHCLVMPVCAGGQLIGALTFYSRRGISTLLPLRQSSATYIQKCIPHIRRARRDIAAERGRVDLEAGLDRLQIGVEVLGFAHDLAGSAHDLYNDVSLMQQTLKTGDLRTALLLANDLRQSSQVVRSLTRAMNRLVEGRSDERTTFDLRAAVSGVKSVIDAMSDNVAVSIPRGLLLFGNPLDVQRIIMNLISNAAFWTNPVSGEIRVSGALVNTDRGEMVELYVSDNGQGMTPTQQRRALGLLYSTRAGGLGLGLYVVKRLTDSLGGQVKIVSAPLAGTTVRIRLPLAKTRNDG